MSNKKLLLPHNATKLEHDITSVISKRIKDIPNPIRSIGNPLTCPAELLPWQAWAYSVDQWEPDWPEDFKRKVIAESIEIHRKKGTTGAIERIFEIIKLPKAELLEWFQYNGEPYFFKINIEHGNTIYNEKTMKKIFGLIEIHKNVRSWLDALSIHLDIDFNLYFGAAIIQTNYIKILPR